MINSSFKLKKLITDYILQEPCDLVLNHIPLLKLNETIKKYKYHFVENNHIKNVLDSCLQYVFLRSCETCSTLHLPNKTFCSHCGDLLYIQDKYNIDLGEYYI